MQSEYQISRILKVYKELEYDETNKCFFGKIFISKNDFYFIKVNLAPFPLSFPVVEELGERIPQSLDRHKYYNSNICCLTTEAMGQILLKTKVKTLYDFFNSMVVPYFKNNSFFEINKKYFKEEYSHGIIGVWEGYQDILNLKNPYQILNVMTNRLSGKNLNIRDECYCGSGEKLKKCCNGKHDINYRKFRLISLEILQKDADNLDKVLNHKVNE